MSSLYDVEASVDGKRDDTEEEERPETPHDRSFIDDSEKEGGSGIEEWVAAYHRRHNFMP